MPLDPKVQKIYTTLKSGGADVGTEQEFNSYFFAQGKKGYENRKKVYDTLTGGGADAGKSYEEFRDWLGLKAVTPQRKQQASAMIGGKATPTQQAQPAPNNMTNWANTNVDMRSEWEKSTQPKQKTEFQQSLETLNKGLKGDAQAAKQSGLTSVNKQLKDRADYQKATGKELKHQIQPDENGEGFDLNRLGVAPTVARDEKGEMILGENGEPLTGIVNDTTRAGVQMKEESMVKLNDQLEEAYAERDRIKELLKNDEEGNKAVQNLIMSGGYDPSENEVLDEHNAYYNALRQAERRITELEAAKNNGGFWRGTWNTLKDPSTYSFGLTDIEDAKQLKRIKDKVDEAEKRGEKPNLTEAEQTFVDNYLANEDAKRQNEDRWWYQQGQNFGNTLSFMKDFAVTGGGFASIAKKGMSLGSRLGKAASNTLFGDYMTKNLGTKALAKTIETTGKALGLVAGTEAGGLALTNTAQAASTAADILNSQTGKMRTDENGNIKFEDGKSLAESILNNEVSRTGENASELFGIAFDAVPGVLGKVIQRTTPGKVLKNLTGNKLWKAGEKGLNYMGVQSVWGEGMEEEYGMLRTEILNTLTNGEYEPGGSGILDRKKQLDTWATIGLTSMLLRVPTMIASGTDAANYYGNKYNLNASDNNMRSTFNNDERYETVKTAIDNADNKSIGGVLNNLMNNANLSTEEKQAMFNYANDLVKMRGFNIGNVVAAANGYKQPPRVSNYNIQGLHVDAVDKDGNVVESYDYDTADDLKTGLYEMQQQRADESLQSDLVVLKSRPDNQYQAFIDSYSEQFGLTPEEFENIVAKPSMERTDEEQEMVAAFSENLHKSVYDNTILHEEQSQEDGQDLADYLSIDLDNLNEQQVAEAQKVTGEYNEAKKQLDSLYEQNEEIKQEVEQMQANGMPVAEIVSSLDTFSTKDVQTVIGYYNAEAKLNGLINRLQEKIDEEAANRRERHTFNGTINGQEDKTNIIGVTDGTNTYTLISGDISTSPEGNVTGSESGMLLALDEEGDIIQLGDTSNLTVLPTEMTLDDYQAQQKQELELQTTGVIDPNETLKPQEEQADVEAGGENTGADEASATPTATERIPVDEEGNPVYEKAAPEDVYDSLTEQVGDMTPTIIKSQLDAAKKRLEKLVKDKEAGKLKGKTIQEQVAEVKELQEKINAEQELVNFWTKVMTVPSNRRLDEETKPKQEPTETTETVTNEAPVEENVPDWTVDKASDARARGYRMENGYRVDRQEPISNKVEGNDIEVKFDKNEEPVKGKLVVVESGSLIPSHVNGQRNVNFFINEAQPKERTDIDSDASSTRIAKKINPEEITAGVTAFTGSPVVNTRGEVIQGNNRTIGLQKMWNNYPDSQDKYKQYLIDHAEEFGLDKDEIVKMSSPVLVRMVDVPDEEAIRLGQKTAANTESGGKERIDPMRVIQLMGDDIRIFTNELFGGEIEGQTLLGIISENGVKVLKWLNDAEHHQKYISDTQFQSCFDAKGNLTEEAKTDLRKIVENLLFQDAPESLPNMFYKMPAKAQSAILSTLWRDSKSDKNDKIIKDIQSSIEAFTVINSASEQFRNAKNVNSARAAVKDMKNQTQVLGDTNTVLEKFSNFALELAVMYKGATQNTIRDYFNTYYDAVQGKGGNLFEPSVKKSKEQAINDIFGIDINENENGEEGNNTLESGNTNGESGEPNNEGEPGVGERVEEGEQPAVSGGGTETSGEVEAATEEQPTEEAVEEQPKEDEILRLDYNEVEGFKDAPSYVRDTIEERALLAYDNARLKVPPIQFGVPEEEKIKLTYDKFLDEFREMAGDYLTKPCEPYLPAVYEYIKEEANKQVKKLLERKQREREEKARLNSTNNNQTEEQPKEEEPFELTLEALEASDLDESVKSGARAWLNGDKTQANQLAFLAAQDYVRSIFRDSERGGTDADTSQLGSEDNGSTIGQNERGNGEGGRVDTADNGEGVPEVGPGGENSTSDVASGNGVRSDNEVPGEASGSVGSTDTNGAVGSSGNRRTGRNGKPRGEGSGRTVPKGNAGRGKKASIREELDAALDEFEDALKESITEPLKGKLLAADPVSLYAFLGGAKAIKVLSAGAKVAYAAIRLGYYEFKDWIDFMKSKIGVPLRNIAGMSDEQIEEFVEMMWDYSLTIDGVTHKVSEWASIISDEKLREEMGKTIEQKRELQKKAEKTPTILEDITNIRESLPFLLPKQQEDVQKAEKQFFNESHADARHGHGKGYLFTNGTGTGKTYTGLGIVKRFLKQGKGRVLIVTVSDTKIKDWIKDAKNLGIEASMLPDTSSKGKGVVVTQYANIRQNNKLLEDEFDLIVYDECQEIMKNQDGSSTSTSRAHHMLANRDERQAARRIIMSGEFGKKVEEADNELELLKQAVNTPTTEWTDEVKKAYAKAGGNMDSVEDRIKELKDLVEGLEETLESKVDEYLLVPEHAAQAREAAKKTKVVFLSATPFNVPANLDYTEGYIFSYTNTDDVEKEAERLRRRDSFLVDNFNSSHKRNPKTQTVSRIPQERIPDPQKASEEEIAFSDNLQNDLETMSGRDLDSEYDYSREFPSMDFAMADAFNDAVQSLSDGRFDPLRKYFDHLLDDYATMTAYLEIFKAQMIAPRLHQYIDLGKKVTLYHRRKASNANMYPPFRLAMEKARQVGDEKIDAAADAFEAAFHRLFEWELSIDYMFPQDSILREFMTEKEKATYKKEIEDWMNQYGEQLKKLQNEVMNLNVMIDLFESSGHKEKTPELLDKVKEKNKEIEKIMKKRPKPKCAVVSVYNGDVSQKERAEAIDKFNDDNSTTKVLVLQVQSGGTGINIHDTTGKYPRVQIGIFLPQSPIEFIQTEGRIFRVGNKSNAIFEYPLLGLDIELGNFAQKINGRSQTTENLALGSRSRGLRESISRAALASRKIDPSTATGIGGKELDSRKAQNADGFDEAMKNYSEWREEPKPTDINQIEVPDPIGYVMTKLTRAEKGERALVPNARRGSVARYMPSSTRLTAMEERNKDYARLSALIGGSGRKILNEPFSEHNRVNKYDIVVINTSHGNNGEKDMFGNATSLDTKDVLKACNHTDPSGRVVALVESDKVGQIKEALKKSTTSVPVMEVKLPSFVLGKPSSIVILDNIENRDKRNAVKTQELDLSQAKTDDNLFAQLRDMIVPERNIDQEGRVERRLRTVVTPFVNTGCLAKSKNYSTNKMEPDIQCTFGRLLATFARNKMVWVRANGRAWRQFVIRYSRIVENDISYIQEIANEWININRQLELDDDSLYDVVKYWLDGKERLGGVRDCLKIMSQAIEIALGKTPMQIKNIAEGRVENEVSGTYDLKGFRDVFNSLNNNDAELEALADKVFEAVDHIEGLKFSVLPGTAFRSGGGHNVVAHYVPSRNVIELNSDIFNSVRYKDSFKAQTVVHEMIHALTTWAIETYDNENTRGQLSPEQQEAVRTIKDVFSQINNDDFRRQLRLESELEDNAEYGLTNEHEMMAELSNPIFRKVLKAKKLWRQLINGVKMLLGIEIPNAESEETDALTALDNALETLMNNYDPTLYSSYIRNNEVVRNMEIRNPNDPMQAINDAAESWRSAKESESTLSEPLQIDESENKNVPLKRRTTNSYTDKDGVYHEGIKEELARLEKEISEEGTDEAKDTTGRTEGNTRPGGEKEGVQGVREGRNSGGLSGRGRNEIRREASRLRAEIARREQEKQELSKKYNIDEKGNISLDDLSRLFHDLNSNKTLAKLFDKVANVLKNLGVDFRFSDKLKGNVEGRSYTFFNATLYNWDSLVRDISDQHKATILLHEMIHNVASHIVDRYNNPEGQGGKLNKKQESIARDINAIYEAVRKADPKRKNGDEPYGLRDANEMIAELANPEFRESLKGIEYNGRNIWQWLKSLYRKMFGLDNTLKSLGDALDDVLETYDGAGISEYKGQRAEIENATNVRGEDLIDTLEDLAYDEIGHASLVQDEDLIDRLEKEPKVKVYRAMQLHDGKLYPPMAAKVNGKWQDPLPIGRWSQADEHPELVDKNGKFTLDKGNGKEVKGVVYAPYMHGSTTMLNDQFKEAQSRPELVVVEAEMPESELTSNYQAEKSPRTTGRVPWKAGTIQGQLTGTRDVILSRWVKPTRIVPVEEVAENIKQMIDGQVEVMPTNVVTPQQREALEKLGVKFVKTDNKEVIQEGEHKGEQYSSAYGKKAKEKAKKAKDDPMEAIRIAASRYRKDRATSTGANPMSQSERAVYEERLDRVETVFSEAYQDSMISLKAGQNAIAHDKYIPDSQNAYMAENLMHGKNKVEMDMFNTMFRDPLIETINRIMEATGMNWGDIDRYVYTKSGLERNREFFVRDWLEKQRSKDEDVDDIEQGWKDTKENAYGKLMAGTITFPQYLEELDTFIRSLYEEYEPSEHDYSGFRAMFGEDYDEEEIINDLMETEDEIGADNVSELWDKVNACTKYGLERYREAGLKSDEQIDNVKNMFHWYVPMRGFKEETNEDLYQYFTGKGKTKNYVGGLLRHAKGRGSEASYPISTIFSMTYKAISDCNQNLVNQKFYRLCQAHKNDLVVLSDAWIKLNEATGEWEEVWPEIDDDMTEEEIRQATLDFEKNMNTLANIGEAQKIKGKANFPYKMLDRNKKNEHVVEVWMNGQKRLVTFVGNPRAAQALNGQLRFERKDNMLSKVNAWIKNKMASLFTSYSPTFALRNMLRDWTHFRTMLTVREGERYAHAAGKYYAEQMPKMMSLFKKYRAGTLGNTEMEQDFKDYMDQGGITGFVQMRKVDDIQKEMEDLNKQMKDGKVVKLNNKVWDYTLGAVEAFNEAIENNARFATFRASRHVAGRTKARSAYDAKEITVNFNRKGAGSKTFGYKGSERVEHAAQAAGITAQVLGEGRIFFNATIQAICTIFKNTQNPDGSLNKAYIARLATRYALPPFMFGFALPLINGALAGLYGDGDDDPYANLPEWTRRKNLCIYIGNNNFITIPVGQELAAFLSLGDMFAGLTYADNLKPLDRNPVEDFADALSTFSPIDIGTKITKGGITKDPIEEVVGRTFSVLAPFVAVGQNLSWTGRPIYREDRFNNDELTPEYQMVYSGVNPVLVEASKKLHELGGGDDVARGKFEVNPAIVQYLWEQYTGGPGKVFSNTISIGKDAKDLLQGNEPDFNVRKVEGLKAFVQQGDDRTEYYRANAKYRKYKEDAEKLYHDIQGYKKLAQTDPMAMMKLEKNTKGVDFTRMMIVRQAEKQISKLNKAANAAEGAKRREIRKVCNEQIKKVVDILDQVDK